jgi:hypothetical protein
MNDQDSRRRDLVSAFAVVILLTAGTALALPAAKPAATGPLIHDLIVLADSDGDGIPDWVDSCPGATSVGPLDLDGDGLRDGCDLDSDQDGVLNLVDRCPLQPGAQPDGCLAEG